MDGLLRDLAFAVRALTRAPLLPATAAPTLAVGIGISTGVLTAACAALVGPLPFADPSRLMVISLHRAGEPGTDVGLRLPDVAGWRSRGPRRSILLSSCERVERPGIIPAGP